MSRYAIIDVETTGLNPAKEKITEIAIVLHNGSEVLDTYETLINPGKKIPYKITALTGITNQMVQDAPEFFEVAKKIVEFTAGCIFVAHNASFDYSFIRSEFQSLGYEYKRKTLCTARLSRKLIPGRNSYSLGKLTKSLGFINKNAHRAASDADVTAKLFQHLYQLKNEPEKINKSELRLSSQFSFLEDLPEETGVYYFYDCEGKLIYVGKAKNILTRVKQHCTNISSHSTLEMRNRISDVDYVLTGSELIALLLESHEIKTKKPVYNRALRRNSFSYGVFFKEDKTGYLSLEAKRITADSEPLASFTSSMETKNYLYFLQEKYNLCQKYLGLFKTDGACFHYGIKQCDGACLGEETTESYNARVREAIEDLQFELPDFFIVEKGRQDDEKAIIHIKNGRFMGFGYVMDHEGISENEILEESIISYPDNRDARQIVRSYIRRHSDIMIIPFNS